MLHLWELCTFFMLMSIFVLKFLSKTYVAVFKAFFSDIGHLLWSLSDH